MMLDALGACEKLTKYKEGSNRNERVVQAHEAILGNAFSLKANARIIKLHKII